MKCRPILVDDTLRELTQHGTPDFPLSMDRQVVADPCHGGVRHWHPEVQIALVTQGEVVFRTEDSDFRLRAGQGFFVNSGVLHEALPTQAADGVYVCVNFLPSLLYGPGEGVVRRDYVDPVLYCQELSSFPLTDDPWQREICGLLEQMEQAEEQGAYGYEIQLTALLCRIWHLVVIHHREQIEHRSTVSFHDRQRIRSLQTFIHRRYMERITLADIAAAGHISRGECCRVFQRVLRVSPIQYLTRFRLDQSMRLLTSTGLSVAEVADQTGFAASSYFIERFRREFGCTPLEYRRRHRQGGDGRKISGS